MKNFLIQLTCILLLSGCAKQYNQDVASSEQAVSDDDRMAWWREARFGLFIHWGLYAVPAGTWKGERIPGISEWIMLRARIPVDEYEKLTEKFNPVKFNADAWVSMAKEAGMKYIVITSKHHDGFAMYHSSVSPYNLVDATPYDRDILKELAEACKKEGIKLGFYHSQAQDWHHPGGAHWGMRNDEPYWDHSVDRVPFMDYIEEKAYPQVEELLTRYGDVAIMWWDTPVGMTEEAAGKLHGLLELQPGIIENNRLYGPWDGDFSTPEQHIPPTGLDYDWEVCMTMNTSWGYKSYDNNWKSSETLVRYLADIASKGGNFLLNVGPTAEGEFPQPSIERLRQMGDWMKKNGAAIYGTEASPFFKLFWGRCTSKSSGSDQILYLHVFDFPENDRIILPGLRNEIKTLQVLSDGSQVPFEDLGDDIRIDLSGLNPDPYNTVLEMQIAGPPDVISNMPAEKSGTVMLPAAYGFIHNPGYGEQAVLSELSEEAYVTHWIDRAARVEFMFSIEDQGEFDVWMTAAAENEASRFIIESGSDTLSASFSGTADLFNFREKQLGSITLASPGVQVITVRPNDDHWSVFNFKGLRLIRK